MTLLDNLFAVAAHPDDAIAQPFRLAIDQLQQGGTASGALEQVSNWHQALTYLADGQGERALLIDLGNHRVALAAHGSGETTRYAFFDPNAGVWNDVADAARLSSALDAYFTPELRSQYAWDGHLRAFPMATTDDAALLLALRQVGRPLLPQGQLLAQQDQHSGPLLIGAARVTRQELSHLGASLAGQPMTVDSDWSRLDQIRLPVSDAEGWLTATRSLDEERTPCCLAVAGCACTVPIAI